MERRVFLSASSKIGSWTRANFLDFTAGDKNKANVLILVEKAGQVVQGHSPGVIEL